MKNREESSDQLRLLASTDPSNMIKPKAMRGSSQATQKTATTSLTEFWRVAEVFFALRAYQQMKTATQEFSPLMLVLAPKIFTEFRL